jgi:hypothetical protein
VACWFDADTIIRTGGNPMPSIEHEDEDEHEEDEYEPIEP